MNANAFRATLCAVALTLPAMAPTSKAQTRSVPPLAQGDEPIVVTTHTIQTAKGPLTYEARIGRLPIRNDETGEVRGWVGFTSYTVKSKTPRPLTFLWNGGPTAPSNLVHTEMFGPRRITDAGFIDNPQTLLSTSDLVFYDPVGTGFARPAKPEYEPEFLSVLGDFTETAEFVRTYRAKFDVQTQPLFLGGESYGTWRANGVTEILTKRGVHVSGVILLSGGVPGSLMPPEFQDAMYVPARTAVAFEMKKLAPDLMRDRAATLKAVDDWAYGVYMPALAKGPANLAPAERERIASDLARYIGLKPEQVDRKTLVVTNNQYRTELLGGGPSRALDRYDMRLVGPQPESASRTAATMAYLRGELGYRTDLAYTPLEDGYMPTPGPARRSTGARFKYDHTEITPEATARMNAGGGPPLSQPWLQNAMRSDPKIRVFVIAGRYDSLNMCEGNRRMTEKLEPALASRFTHACLEGGHMMYRVEASRIQLSEQIARFIASAAKP